MLSEVSLCEPTTHRWIIKVIGNRQRIVALKVNDSRQQS